MKRVLSFLLLLLSATAMAQPGSGLKQIIHDSIEARPAGNVIRANNLASRMYAIVDTALAQPLRNIARNGNSIDTTIYIKRPNTVFPQNALIVGHSIAIGQGCTVHDSAFTERFAKLMGWSDYTNLGRGGTSYALTVYDANRNLDPGHSNALIVHSGINDISCVTDATTAGKFYKLSMATVAALAANQYLSAYYDAGGSGVTRTGTWTTSVNMRTFTNGKSANGAISTTSGSKISRTFTDSTAVIVASVGLGSTTTFANNVDIKIDGSVVATVNMNGYGCNNSVSAAATFDGRHTEAAWIFRGLSYASHTIEIINNTSDTLAVDYIGHWCTNAQGKAKPIYLWHTLHYSSFDAFIDYNNASIDSLLGTFKRSSITTINGNPGWNKSDATLTGDGLHPNDKGNRLIFNVYTGDTARAGITIEIANGGSEPAIRVKNSEADVFGVKADGSTIQRGIAEIKTIPYLASKSDWSDTSKDYIVQPKGDTLEQTPFEQPFHRAWQYALNKALFLNPVAGAPNAGTGRVMAYTRGFVSGNSTYQDAAFATNMAYSYAGGHHMGLFAGSASGINNRGSFDIIDDGGAGSGLAIEFKGASNYGAFMFYNNNGTKVGGLFVPGSSYANDGYVSNSVHLDNYTNNSTTTMMFWGTGSVFRVAMGTNATSGKKFDVATDKASFFVPVVFPILTTSQRNALTPANGWTIICSDCTPTNVMQTYDGSTWQSVR